MKRSLVSILCTLLVITFMGNGCAHKKPESEKTAQELAAEGESLLNAKRYQKAIDTFKNLKDWYPFSTLAAVADLKIADAYFQMEDYENAASAYEDFERLHPQNKSVPYAIYREGLCYYYRLDTIDRDQTPARKAIEAFSRLVNRYPDCEYSKKAAEYIVKCRKSLAGHELYVGKFYYKMGHYKAALHRLNRVISDYPDVGELDEARHYISIITDNLVKALSDEDPDVRLEAVKTLGKTGPKTDPAVDALIHLLSNDTNENVRAAAMLALGNVAPGYRTKALSAVIAALSDDSSRVRLGAIQTISAFGIYNNQVEQALEKTGHEDESIEVKEAALNALIVMKTKAAKKLAAKNKIDNKGSVKTPPSGVKTAAPSAESAVSTPVPEKNTAIGRAACPKITAITADALNIRSGPGLAYKKLGKLFPNERPKVLKVDGKWIKIQTTNGLTGFVSRDYVILEGE